MNKDGRLQVILKAPVYSESKIRRERLGIDLLAVDAFVAKVLEGSNTEKRTENPNPSFNSIKQNPFLLERDCTGMVACCDSIDLVS